MRILCLLTDHRFSMSSDSPEPYCSRCGWSDYWPVRRTVGRFWEDFRYWLRARRIRDLPF